jgi:anti-sigma factor RsiW
VDGELPPAATAALKAHLRGCRPCRAHVAALRRLVTALRRQGAHQPAAPAALRARAREIAARWHAADAAAGAAPPSGTPEGDAAAPDVTGSVAAAGVAAAGPDQPASRPAAR